MPFWSIHVLLVAWSRWNCYSAEHVTITLRFTCLHPLNINIQVVNVGAASTGMAVYHNHDINDFMKVFSPFPQVIRVKACMKERERVHILTHILLHEKNKSNISMTLKWQYLFTRNLLRVHIATMTQRFASSWHQFNHSHTWKQRQIHASSLKRVLIYTPKKQTNILEYLFTCL